MSAQRRSKPVTAAPLSRGLGVGLVGMRRVGTRRWAWRAGVDASVAIAGSESRVPRRVHEVAERNGKSRRTQ